MKIFVKKTIESVITFCLDWLYDRGRTIWYQGAWIWKDSEYNGRACKYTFPSSTKSYDKAKGVSWANPVPEKVTNKYNYCKDQNGYLDICCCKVDYQYLQYVWFDQVSARPPMDFFYKYHYLNIYFDELYLESESCYMDSGMYSACLHDSIMSPWRNSSTGDDSNTGAKSLYLLRGPLNVKNLHVKFAGLNQYSRANTINKNSYNERQYQPNDGIYIELHSEFYAGPYAASVMQVARCKISKIWFS